MKEGGGGGGRNGERAGGGQRAGEGRESGNRGSAGESGRAGTNGREGGRAGTNGREGGRENGRVGARGGERLGGPITGEQRTRLRPALRGLGGARLGRVDFAVRTGVVVPGSYRFSTLPGTIVDIVPQYRGFYYLLVGEQILVVEPRTRRIVDVL